MARYDNAFRLSQRDFLNMMCVVSARGFYFNFSIISSNLTNVVTISGNSTYGWGGGMAIVGGGATTNLSNVTITNNMADYENAGGGTAVTLAASNNCTITVTFTPQSTGVINASLTISSNDSDTPNQNISLTGTGAAQTGGNTGGNGGGGGGGGGCGGFIQDAGNKNRDNSSLILSFILMLIISLTGISLARRVIRA